MKLEKPNKRYEEKNDDQQEKLLVIGFDNKPKGKNPFESRSRELSLIGKSNQTSLNEN